MRFGVQKKLALARENEELNAKYWRYKENIPKKFPFKESHAENEQPILDRKYLVAFEFFPVLSQAWFPR